MEQSESMEEQLSAPRRDPDELRPVASLFADIVGSTALGERLTPAEVKALIGECVSRMCEVVESFGGGVRSYMGDGIAGFFGIDAAREDDAERAARAALEIRSTLREYAREVEEAWGVTDFNVRIGINVGRVAVGQIGSGEPQRLALGDSINVAARLQAAARPGSIIVGDAVRRALPSGFVLQPMGELEVRGRREPVLAFELYAEDAQTSRRSSEGRFVGRSFELQLLARAVSDVCEGRGQVVLLAGDAGVGKSRLLLEARVRAPSSVLWLDACCDATDERLPYQPFAEALCAWLGVSRHASPIELRVRLATLGRSLLGDDFEDVVPSLARILGIPLTNRLDRRMDGLSGEDVRSTLTRSLAAWLSALSRQQAVVLDVDGLHSAADATVQALEALLPHVEANPILMLLTARSDVYGPWERVRATALTQFRARTTECLLTPLSDADSRELLVSIEDGHVLPSTFVDVIVDRAEGNPLYIEQLVAAVSGSVDADATAKQIPSTLEGVLLARIDALPVRARRALQFAAVLGRSFMHEVLLEMLGDESAEEDVAALVRADVIRERGRQPKAFTFRHGLTREAALSTLTPAYLRNLNSLAAEALRTWDRFDSDRDASTLVGYYINADREEDAVDCVDRLASQLIRLSRLEDAAALLENCVEKLGQLDDREAFAGVAAKLARVLEEQGKPDAAIAWLSAIQRESIGSRNWGVLIATARCLATLGQSAEAESLLRLCCMAATDDLVRVDARLELAVLALNREDVALAASYVESLGPGVDAPQQRDRAFRVASLMAGVDAMRGRLNDAELWSLRALEIADQTGQLGLQLRARHQASLVCMLKGGYLEASARMEGVYDDSLRLGVLSGIAETVVSLVHLKTQCGELLAAERIGDESLETLRDRGSWPSLAVNLAGVKVERGKFSTANQLARSALQEGLESPAWVICGARLVLASTARLERDDSREIEELSLALEIAERQGADRPYAHICLEWAERSLRDGDCALAAQWLDRASVAKVGVDSTFRARSKRMRALLAARDDVGGGIESLSDDIGELRRQGLRLEEARSLLVLARLDTVGSERWFSEAEVLFRACGSELGLAEVAAERQRALTTMHG